MTAIDVGRTVYTPQQDSMMLVDALRPIDMTGKNALDLCCGSGIVGLAAARLGAEVTAIDASPEAVAVARQRARECGLSQRYTAEVQTVATFIGGRFDLVTCNPPYVPTPSDDLDYSDVDGPVRAWNGGLDGRKILDVVCGRLPSLLTPGGTALVVHSELAQPATTLALLRGLGLDASVIDERTIPFGPVLTARTQWLTRTGLLTAGQVTERLVVIRAEAVRTEHEDAHRTSPATKAMR